MGASSTTKGRPIPAGGKGIQALPMTSSLRQAAELENYKAKMEARERERQKQEELKRLEEEEFMKNNQIHKNAKPVNINKFFRR